MELNKHFVQCAADTRFLLAFAGFVPFGKIVIAYEWIVYQGLEYDAHEAGLTHVVKASEAYRAAREEGGVVDDELDLVGGRRIFVFTLFAYATVNTWDGGLRVLADLSAIA